MALPENNSLFKRLIFESSTVDMHLVVICHVHLCSPKVRPHKMPDWMWPKPSRHCQLCAEVSDACFPDSLLLRSSYTPYTQHNTYRCYAVCMECKVTAITYRHAARRPCTVRPDSVCILPSFPTLAVCRSTLCARTDMPHNHATPGHARNFHA